MPWAREALRSFAPHALATWNPGKWETTWLRNEPPGAAPRDKARSRLERDRVLGTKPSLSIAKYAGVYNSKLYGQLVIERNSDRLSVMFGEYTTELVHWQNDSFYVRSPTRLTFDWLLTFAQTGDGLIAGVTVQHIGWDQDERDHLFVRSR